MLLKNDDTLRIFVCDFIFILFYFSFLYFECVLNKIIIPRVLIGYETIIDNSALRASLATYYLISNARWWNNLWVYSKIVRTSECHTEQTSCIIISTQKNPKSFGLEKVTEFIGIPSCCSDNKSLLLLLLFFFLLFTNCFVLVLF